MGLAIRKPIPDTQNTCVDMSKQRNALQKSFQMIQSNFYHKSDPDFYDFSPHFRLQFTGNLLCPKVSHRPICHIVSHLS